MSYNQNQKQENFQNEAPPPYLDQSSSYLSPNSDKYLFDANATPNASRSNSPLPPETPRRGSRESSAAESDYDNEIAPFMSTTNAFRVYDVLHTKSHINARIVDAASKQPLYYVDNSAFTKGKPDVRLCRGSEKTSPVVGVTRWSHMYSKHLKIGVGNAAVSESGMLWEEVATEGRMHPEWKWSVTGPDGQRHTFAWSRLKGQEAYNAGGEGTNKLSFKNFKLVYVAGPAQTGNGDLLATFSSNRLKSWSKLGKVIVRVDGVARGFGENWEIMVLLSVLGLVEMGRRRGRQRRSAPGGTGGN